MTDIRIRKIDIDDLRSGEPPSWGRVSAIINGVEVQLTLDQDRINRLLDVANPLAMELVDEITKGPRRVVVEMKHEPVRRI